MSGPFEGPTWVCGECQGARMPLWATHCSRCERRRNIYLSSGIPAALASSWVSPRKSVPSVTSSDQSSVPKTPETKESSATSFDQSSVPEILETKESLKFTPVQIARKGKARHGDVKPLFEIEPFTTNQDNDCDTLNSFWATFAAPKMVHWFVNDLFGRLTSKGLIWDAQTIENASSLLPSLLNAFASKIGCEDDTPTHLQAVAFIEKYKLELTEFFVERCSSPNKTNFPTSKLSFQEERGDSQRGLSDHIYSGYIRIKSVEEQLKSDFKVNYEDKEVMDFQKIILETRAYDWLISRITLKLTFFSPEPSIMDAIAQHVQTGILSSSEPRLAIRGSQSFIHEVTFEMDWDLIAFIKEQCYDENPQDAIARAITLTGTATEAQATLAAQYIKEIWPYSGEHTMKLVQYLVSEKSRSSPLYLLPDSTLLKGWTNSSKFVVRAKGTESSIIEIAEQLAWLRAALCTSPYEYGIAVCSPKISKVSTGHGWEYLEPKIDAHFMLSLSTHRLVTDPNHSDGQCWQSLFLNPVLVRGYPIARRMDSLKGLELSLDVMATLIQAPRVTFYGATPFLKGFSALVTPTKVEKNIMLWHLVFNEDQKQRISYNDSRIHRILDPKAEQFNIAQLESARHILGWASQVKSLTGTPTASYSIAPSGLRRTQPGCVLEKVSISGGKFISAGMTAAIGKKDKGVFIKPRENYLYQLKWIAHEYILLFDVNDRRAWLVDGASALLHLVRSSIKHLQNQKEFGGLCLFKWDHFQEATQQASGKEAAVSVLTNEENMHQKLFKKPVEEWQEESVDTSGKSTVVTKLKTTFFRFSDKVEQTYHMLEEIIDHQAAATEEDGLRFKFRTSPRRQLEGFEFMDIAEDRDPLHPHVHSLHDIGKGWIDLVRAIHATTLFGNGFGELIKPTVSKELCPSWMEVPKGKNYLAVSVPIMEELLRRRGDKKEIPWRVVDEIFWHTPSKTFEACHCRHVPSKVHCNRVQVLLPSGFRGKGFSSPTYLEDEGALIFGHSLNFPLRGGAQVDHSQEVIQQECEEPPDDDAAPDSGIGSKTINPLTDRCSAKAGENSFTQSDVLASKVPLAQNSMNSVSRKFTLISFGQLLRRFRRHSEYNQPEPE